MSTNPKNKLQEYCQKRGLPLPVYETSHSGKVHSPNFISTVRFTMSNTNDVPYHNITGEHKKRVIDAEKSAADFALLKIDKSKKKFTIHDKKPLTVLWDLENINAKEFFDNCYLSGTDVETVSFVTAHHPQSFISYPFNKTVKIDSQHRDSADMALVMYLSSSITSGRGGHYIVVTKDHFAASLDKCIANHDIIPYREIRGKHPNFTEPSLTQAQSIDHFIHILEQHCSHT